MPHTPTYQFAALGAALALLASSGTAFAQPCPVDTANQVFNDTLPTCVVGLPLYTVNAGSTAGVLASGAGHSITIDHGAPFTVNSDNGTYRYSRGIMADAGAIDVSVPTSVATTTSPFSANWDQNHAVFAVNGGRIRFVSTLDASTSTHNSYVVHADAGGSIELGGDTIVTTSAGVGTDGLFAFKDGKITQTGGIVDITINETGGYSYGIRADSHYGNLPSNPAEITIGGGSIQTAEGDSNTAIRAIRGGIVNIADTDDLTIATSGLGARGWYVSGTHHANKTEAFIAQINQAAGRTTSITTGLSDGIQVGKAGTAWGNAAGDGPGLIRAFGRVEVTVNTPDLLAYFAPDQADAALRIVGGDASLTSRYNAGSAGASGVLTSKAGPAVAFGQGNGNAADLHDYALVGGLDDSRRGLIHAGANAQNSILTLRGASTAMPNTAATEPYLIDATDATASLDIQVLDSASITGMSRTNGATVDVALSDGSAGASAIWTLRGRTGALRASDTATVSTLTLHAGGTLDASAGNASGATYHLAGNLIAAGGSVALDAVLNDGTSDPLSDVLTIDGDTSGSGVLNITNAGGAGAATADDGILVMQVTGNSDASFTLAQPLTVGDWQYTLRRGTSSPAAAKNWYLVASPYSPPVPTGSHTPIPAGPPLTWLLTGMGVALLVVRRLDLRAGKR